MRQLYSREIDKLWLHELLEELKTYKRAMDKKYDNYKNGKEPTRLEQEYMLYIVKRMDLLKPERALTIEDGDLLEINDYHEKRNITKMKDKNINENEIRPMGEDRSFRAMFCPEKAEKNERLDKGGFFDSGEFFSVLESGRFDPRLQARAVRASMVEGIPSLGGFSVPTQFVSEWLDASLEDEVTRKHAKVYPMTSNSIFVPGFDAADFSSGEYAGLRMNFISEGATATKQVAKLRGIQLVARMGVIYVDSSLEVLSDGVGFEENLKGAMIASIGHGIDRHCIGSAGTGAGKPVSVLNSAANIAISGEVGQVASSIVYQNLKKIFARQLNPQKARWVANPSTISHLLELSVDIGTSGSHVPVLQESSGQYKIFGRPVDFSSVVPAVGSAGTIQFIDWNYYALGMRQDVVIQQTDSARWNERERSYRVLIRFDGMCSLDKKIAVENGDSLSPVVSLAAIA